MNQLALDLLLASPPRLENFVPGPNAEVLALLDQLGSANALTGPGPGPHPLARQLHLWGPPGSGRSHLLKGLAERLGATARLLDGTSPLAAFRFEPHASGWLIDDVQELNADRQQALFDLINQVRGHLGAVLVTTADAPALGLALREDLRTRLGWGATLAIRPLTDEDKALALLTRAAQRGVAMSEEVANWLITHTSRDMRVLTALLDQLDHHALARQRAITPALVREFLRAAPGTDP